MQEAPRVFRDLREKVLPVYCDTNDIERALPPTPSLTDIPDELREALHEWADFYNLSVDWMLSAALDTLREWIVWFPKDPRQGLDMEVLGSVPTSENDAWSPFPARRRGPMLPRWNPWLKSWGDYEKWIENEVLPVVLQAHREQCEREAETLGLVKPKKLRGQSLHRHLTWLVQWEVLQLRRDRILAEHQERTGEELEPSTIHKGVTKVAELIGLPLTPRQPERN
jgi:hypothetical protein